MVSKKTYRIPDNLIKQIQRDMERRNITSENEWAIQAFQHVLTCKKLEPNAEMKLIVLRYPAKCIKCGSNIDAGSWGLWGRGVGAVCMDCYIERIGDKALVAKWLKMRQYQRLIKALKNEAERLGTEVEMYKLGEKVKKIDGLVSELHKKVMEYLRAQVGTADENKALEEITVLCGKAFEVLRDVQNWLEQDLEKKKGWARRARRAP